MVYNMFESTTVSRIERNLHWTAISTIRYWPCICRIDINTFEWCRRLFITSHRFSRLNDDIAVHNWTENVMHICSFDDDDDDDMFEHK